MKNRSLRLATFAVIALLFPMQAGFAPSQAASSDAAMLQSYAGTYSGSGAITGDQPQTVRCRLSITAAPGGNLNYNGRCNSLGANFAMSGVISAANGRFQAAMSGSSMGGPSVSSTVTGTRRNGGVVFSSRQHDTTGGHDRTVSSNFALVGGGIRLDFKALDAKTGKTSSGTINFTKS